LLSPTPPALRPSGHSVSRDVRCEWISRMGDKCMERPLMRVVRMEEICMRVLVSTLGIAMLAQSCLGQTSPKTTVPGPQASIAGFAIAVDGPTPPVHFDSPININITVTNVSGKEILVAMG